MAKRRIKGNVNKSIKKECPNAYSEIVAIFIIAIGLLIGVSFFSEAGGIFGSFTKNKFMGLMGPFIYPIPLLVIAYGIHSIINKGKPDYAHKYKYIYIVLLIVMAQAFTHIFISRPEDNMTFRSILYFSYHNGVDGSGGGFIGALVAEPLINMFGTIGASIIFVVAAIIILILITQISVLKTSQFIVDLFKKLFSSLFNLSSDKDKKDDVKNKKEYRAKKEKAEDDKLFVKDMDSIRQDQEEVFDSFKVIDHMIKSEKIETEKQLQIDDIINESSENKQRINQSKREGLPDKNEGVKDFGISIPYGKHIEYCFPPTDILTMPPQTVSNKNSTANLRSSAKKLTETLKSFGVDVKVVQVSKGPSITRFELQPSVGVKVSKIVNLADDIALNLAASGVRIEAPIPGKAAIGIEIANDEILPVLLREVIDSDEFNKFPSKLAFSIGKDITGRPIVADISKMPHLLIAGATGSGKSVCINSLIISILYKANPNEVKLVMIDPKVVELGVYNGIPHLLIPVVTDPKKAASALNWAVQEMVRRYKLFADNNVRDIAGFNTVIAQGIDNDIDDEEENKPLPQIVIIIDELADLMMVAPGDVENAICRLAQMARAAGMHLVIATQRPSVDVITGVIKANIPSRISFAVSSQVDSRTILDMAGAEKLLGRGDMLFFPVGAAKPVRLQGAFISDKEVENVVRYIKDNSGASYNEDIIEHLESENGVEEFEPGDNDELLPKAIEIVVESGQASISMLQRRLRLGYARAARMIDQMEARGIVGGYEGSKPRQILITKDQYHEMLLSSDGLNH